APVEPRFDQALLERRDPRPSVALRGMAQELRKRRIRQHGFADRAQAESLRHRDRDRRDELRGPARDDRRADDSVRAGLGQYLDEAGAALDAASVELVEARRVAIEPDAVALEIARERADLRDLRIRESAARDDEPVGRGRRRE